MEQVVTSPADSACKALDPHWKRVAERYNKALVNGAPCHFPRDFDLSTGLRHKKTPHTKLNRFGVVVFTPKADAVFSAAHTRSRELLDAGAKVDDDAPNPTVLSTTVSCVVSCSKQALELDAEALPYLHIAATTRKPACKNERSQDLADDDFVISPVCTAPDVLKKGHSNIIVPHGFMRVEPGQASPWTRIGYSRGLVALTVLSGPVILRCLSPVPKDEVHRVFHCSHLSGAECGAWAQDHPTSYFAIRNVQPGSVVVLHTATVFQVLPEPGAAAANLKCTVWVPEAVGERYTAAELMYMAAQRREYPKSTVLRRSVWFTGNGQADSWTEVVSHEDIFADPGLQSVVLGVPHPTLVPLPTLSDSAYMQPGGFFEQAVEFLRGALDAAAQASILDNLKQDEPITLEWMNKVGVGKNAAELQKLAQKALLLIQTNQYDAFNKTLTAWNSALTRFTKIHQGMKVQCAKIAASVEQEERLGRLMKQYEQVRAGGTEVPDGPKLLEDAQAKVAEARKRISDQHNKAAKASLNRLERALSSEKRKQNKRKKKDDFLSGLVPHAQARALLHQYDAELAACHEKVEPAKLSYDLGLGEYDDGYFRDAETFIATFASLLGVVESVNNGDELVDVTGFEERLRALGRYKMPARTAEPIEEDEEREDDGGPDEVEEDDEYAPGDSQEEKEEDEMDQSAEETGPPPLSHPILKPMRVVKPVAPTSPPQPALPTPRPTPQPALPRPQPAPQLEPTPQPTRQPTPKPALPTPQPQPEPTPQPAPQPTVQPALPQPQPALPTPQPQPEPTPQPALPQPEPTPLPVLPRPEPTPQPALPRATRPAPKLTPEAPARRPSKKRAREPDAVPEPALKKHHEEATQRKRAQADPPQAAPEPVIKKQRGELKDQLVASLLENTLQNTPQDHPARALLQAAANVCRGSSRKVTRKFVAKVKGLDIEIESADNLAELEEKLAPFRHPLAALQIEVIAPVQE